MIETITIHNVELSIGTEIYFFGNQKINTSFGYIESIHNVGGVFYFTIILQGDYLFDEYLSENDFLPYYLPNHKGKFCTKKSFFEFKDHSCNLLQFNFNTFHRKNKFIMSNQNNSNSSASKRINISIPNGLFKKLLFEAKNKSILPGTLVRIILTDHFRNKTFSEFPMIFKTDITDS